MRGLLMTGGDARRIGLAAGVPMFALFMLGVANSFVGSERDRPIGILVFILIVTAVFIAGRIFGTDRRTKAGKAAVKDAQPLRAHAHRAARDGDRDSGRSIRYRGDDGNGGGGCGGCGG